MKEKRRENSLHLPKLKTAAPCSAGADPGRLMGWAASQICPMEAHEPPGSGGSQNLRQASYYVLLKLEHPVQATREGSFDSTYNSLPSTLEHRFGNRRLTKMNLTLFTLGLNTIVYVAIIP